MVLAVGHETNFSTFARRVGSLALVFSTGLTADATGTGADFKGPIGLQLYSLRAQFNKDVPGHARRSKKHGHQIRGTGQHLQR